MLPEDAQLDGPGHRLTAAADAELLENVLQVCLDRCR
jgi:hypothetical protein